MQLNPLMQLDWRVILATVLIFVATYFVMRRVFYDKVVAVMEDRREHIDECQGKCAEARALVETAQKDADEMVASAEAERESLLSAARERAQSERSAKIADVQHTAERRLEQGRLEIASERQGEIARLVREANECVGLACAKLVGPVEDETIAPIVDRIVEKRLN
jgi:F0F1-type ATP synthase membrane subunit b/b'